MPTATALTTRAATATATATPTATAVASRWRQRILTSPDQFRRLHTDLDSREQDRRAIGRVVGAVAYDCYA